MTFLYSLLAFIPIASAQEPPPLPCGSLPGCDGGGGNILAEHVLPNVITLMLRVAGGAALIFVILAGYQMFLSQGDESKISKAKWSVVLAMLGLGLAVVSQMIVATVVTEPTVLGITDEVTLFSAVRQILVTVLDIVFLGVVVYASILMLITQGKPEAFKKASTWVTWAIVGAVIVNGSNAMVQLVASFFGV